MFSYSVNSLIVFYEVVRSKSFSRAAAVLSMTQPGISNHVSQLEAQTGARLLNREKGRFELTKEGRVIFRYAEKMQKAARELEQSIRAMVNETQPVIRIGTTPTYTRILMPYILGGFQKEHPQMMIKLDSGSSGEMVKSVVSMQNDVIIVANPKLSRKLYSFPLLKEKLAVIVHKDHPLSSRDFVSLREVGQHPLIIREEGSATREVVLAALASLDIKPFFLMEAKSTEFIKEWVSQGKGISILIERAIMEEEKKLLRMVPLEEPLNLEISVVFLKAKKCDCSIQRFIGHLQNVKLP